MIENKGQVGETTGQSTENKPVDKESASRLANVLEGFNFPADKAKILSFVNQKLAPAEGENNDLIKTLQNNLTDNKQYGNVYEIGKQAGLVK
jgi:hypothetical protein